MKIAIISGSHRNESESERIGHFIENELKTFPEISTWFFALRNNPLPLWDEGVWAHNDQWKTKWGPIAKELQSADGFVVVSPEWAGMVPPGLKNFFLLCTPAEVGHKPALIVTVSSGVGGAYPVNELRTSSYKNSKICYLPEHVIVRSAEKMFKGATPTDSHDESIRKRLSYSLKLLKEYSHAFKSIRESGVIDNKNFPFGM